MSQTTPRQTVYNIAAGYKAATGDTDELNYGNIADKVTKALNDEYQYPSHWPDIRTNTTDDIVILVSDVCPDVTFLVVGKTSSTKISIDWGDGTVETNLQTNVSNVYKGMSVSASYKAHHHYATQGTEDGYKTYIIKINQTTTGSNFIAGFRVWGQDDHSAYQSWLAIKTNTSTPTSLVYMAGCFNQTINIGVCSYLEYVDISSCSAVTTLNYACYDCYRLQKLILPTSMSALASMTSTCTRCYMLKKIAIPNAPLLSSISGICNYCASLEEVIWKGTSYPALYSIGSAFSYTKLKEFSFPATMNTDSTKNGTFTSVFYYTIGLKKLTLPTNNDWADNITNMSAFLQLTGLPEIDFSGVSMSKVTNLNAFGSSTMTLVLKFPKAPKIDTTTSANLFNSSNNLMEEIYFPSEYGSTSHPQQTWDLTNYRNLKKLSANCGVNLQKITCKGYANSGRTSIVRGSLTEVTLPPNSNFGGAAPQIDFTDQALDHTALVNLLTYLGTLNLTGKQVKITNCVGTDELTAAEIALATGWTVITS